MVISFNKANLCIIATSAKSHTIPYLLDMDRQVDDNVAEAKVPSHPAVRLKSSVLLMTCCILVSAPDGPSVEARALLDNASLASFVSECLVKSHCLPRNRQNVRVSGLGGP